YMVDQLFATAPYVWMEKVWDFKDSVNQILESRVGSRTFEKSKNYGLNLASMIYEYSKSDGGHQSYIRSYDMEYRLRVCDACFEIHREADLENTGPLHPGWVVNRTFMKENATDFGIVPKVVFSKYPNS